MIIPIVQTGFSKKLYLPIKEYTVSCMVEQQIFEIEAIESNVPLTVEYPNWVDSIQLVKTDVELYKAVVYISTGLDNEVRTGDIIFSAGETLHKSILVIINSFDGIKINTDAFDSKNYLGCSYSLPLIITSSKMNYEVRALDSPENDCSWINIEKLKTKSPISSETYNVKIDKFITRQGRETRTTNLYVNNIETNQSIIDPISITQQALSYIAQSKTEYINDINKKGETRKFSFTLHKDIKFEVITNRHQSIGSEEDTWFFPERSQDYWIHLKLDDQQLDQATEMVTYNYSVVFDEDNLDYTHEDYNSLGRQAYILIYSLDEHGNRYIEINEEDPTMNRYDAFIIQCHQLNK